MGWWGAVRGALKDSRIKAQRPSWVMTCGELTTPSALFPMLRTRGEAWGGGGRHDAIDNDPT